jgi:hypothetical protein
MKPHIDQTTFGSITIEGAVFSHDVMMLHWFQYLAAE